MSQDRTQYSNIILPVLHKVVFALCLIFSASIFSQQDQAAVDIQNPTVYDYPVPFAQQENGISYYNQEQGIADPPPGPYQALPDFYPYGEPVTNPEQQAYSMPPANTEQGAGLPPEMPVASPADNSAYAYPQYAPPPQTPVVQDGSRGNYSKPPQYGVQDQGYPAYGGRNYGYYQPPAYAYPPPGNYQYRAPQGYQGYYQGQQNVPAENTYRGQGAYDYPYGSGSQAYPNRNPGIEAVPVKPKNTVK